ncbi:hypothetical protein SNEBB_011407 [Seison nebaliae]|nr:hypothetical protein SNEBB_011407 [Seison nebaliae]
MRLSPQVGRQVKKTNAFEESTARKNEAEEHRRHHSYPYKFSLINGIVSMILLMIFITVYVILNYFSFTQYRTLQYIAISFHTISAILQLVIYIFRDCRFLVKTILFIWICDGITSTTAIYIAVVIIRTVLGKDFHSEIKGKILATCSVLEFFAIMSTIQFLMNLGIFISRKGYCRRTYDPSPLN